MKLERNGYRYSIKGITKNDIFKANLRAEKDPNSAYEAKPSYGIWINDQDILDFFADAGVKINETRDRDNPEIVKYSVFFRAYPRIKIDTNGKDYQDPIIMLKKSDGEDYIHLWEEDFKDADTKSVKNVDLAFYFWTARNGSVIPKLTFMKIELDPFASGPSRGDYIRDNFGVDLDVKI